MSVGVWCSATISALWLYLEVNDLKGDSIVRKDRGIANPGARIGGGGGCLFPTSMSNSRNANVVCHCRLFMFP